jgi:hypothetical protein
MKHLKHFLNFRHTRPRARTGSESASGASLAETEQLVQAGMDFSASALTRAGVQTHAGDNQMHSLDDNVAQWLRAEPTQETPQPITEDQLAALIHGDSRAPAGEEEILDLLDALESLDRDGRLAFVSGLPPECRALLLACARRSGHQSSRTRTRGRASSAPALPAARSGGA